MKRISIVVLILCGCFVSVAWGQQPAGNCNNNWSEFHRTNMERWNPCEKVLGVNNVGNLSLKWFHYLGARVTSDPAVADGKVYLGSAGYVYALKASTGAKVWSYAAGDHYVTSSPAVANGVVYVFAGDWNLYALNAKTGAKLWSYAISKVSIASGSPVVANAVVYIDPGKRDVYAFGLKQDRK